MSENQCAEQLLKEALQIAAKRLQDGKNHECAAICQQVLKVDVENITAKKLLGLVRFQQKRVDEAIEIYQDLLKTNGEDYECHNNISLCLSSIGRHDEAIRHLLKASTIRTDLCAHWGNLGHQFRQKRDFQTAISFFHMALEKEAQAQTCVNLSGCYGELLQFDKAIHYLHKAIEIDPNCSAAHIDLACASFLVGDWKTAWKEYDWRFVHYPHVKARSECFDPQKKWDGRPLMDHEIMAVYCEQGIGDVFNFLRFVTPLRQHSKHIKLLLPGDTRSLLRSQFEGVCEDQDIIEYDWHCSMMSLPILLELTPDQIRRDNKPYIKPNKIADGIKNGTYKNKFKIGICWGGNPQHPRDKQRSCPLSMFRRIYHMDGVKLFSLQKDTRPRVWPGEESVDLSSHCSDLKIVDLSLHMNDWDDTAGLVAAMDLILTVDTSMLHLAGAMGVPTIALIPFLPDWRWGLDSEDTIWYESVKLFRQRRPGDWEEVFERVAEEISLRIRSASSSHEDVPLRHEFFS